MTRRHQPRRGFTLIEVMVAIMVFGVVVAISVINIRNYAIANDEVGDAQGITSTLRNAQERAITEGNSYCVNLDTATKTLTTYRGSCATGTAVAKMALQGSLDRLVNPSFSQTDGSVTSYVTFTARGSASPGTVQVTRSNSSKSYTVTVEGMTGRVSYS